ncbi:MAG: hypothetical protein J6S97_07880 [Bacteroidales bacterium]|nr:hypothetical protein [Bacteroidales bacterium]
MTLKINPMTDYQRPLCETEEYVSSLALLAGSDLTDEGAGDILTPGEIYDL